MMSENFKPEWYPNIEGDGEAKVAKVTKVTKVAKVTKRRNLYRVMGLSAPLLAAGVILAFAQPPSSSPSTPNSQVNISLATKIQTTATPTSSIQKPTAVSLKSLKVNKSVIVKKDTSYTFVSTQKTPRSSTLSPTPSLALGVNKPSISGSTGGDDNNDD